MAHYQPAVSDIGADEIAQVLEKHKRCVENWMSNVDNLAKEKIDYYQNIIQQIDSRGEDLIEAIEAYQANLYQSIDESISHIVEAKSLLSKSLDNYKLKISFLEQSKEQNIGMGIPSGDLASFIDKSLAIVFSEVEKNMNDFESKKYEIEKFCPGIFEINAKLMYGILKHESDANTDDDILAGNTAENETSEGTTGVYSPPENNSRNSSGGWSRSDGFHHDNEEPSYHDRPSDSEDSIHESVGFDDIPDYDSNSGSDFPDFRSIKDVQLESKPLFVRALDSLVVVVVENSCNLCTIYKENDFLLEIFGYVSSPCAEATIVDVTFDKTNGDMYVLSKVDNGELWLQCFHEEAPGMFVERLHETWISNVCRNPLSINICCDNLIIMCIKGALFIPIDRVAKFGLLKKELSYLDLQAEKFCVVGNGPLFYTVQTPGSDLYPELWKRSMIELKNNFRTIYKCFNKFCGHVDWLKIGPLHAYLGGISADDFYPFLAFNLKDFGCRIIRVNEIEADFSNANTTVVAEYTNRHIIDFACKTNEQIVFCYTEEQGRYYLGLVDINNTTTK